MSTGKKIVIEIFAPGMHRPQLVTFDKDSITVGRAFHCDLILKDDFVSREHIRIVLDSENGGFRLVDLDSQNGTIVHKCFIMDDTAYLASGQECRLGKTRLRVYREDHALEPARKFNWGTKMQAVFDQPFVSFLLFALAVSVTVFSGYLSGDPETFMDQEVYTYSAGAGIVILGLALFVSLVNLVHHRKAAFTRQISLWAVITALTVVYSAYIEPHLYFHVTDNMTDIALTVFTIVVLIVLIGVFIAYVNNGRVRQREVLVFLVIGLGIAGLAHINDIGYSAAPAFPSTLIVGEPHISGAQTVDRFLTETQTLYDQQ